MSSPFAALRILATAGNILFILWVTFNSIDEGFSGTIFQKISYLALVVLLILDIVLLWCIRQRSA